MRITKSGLVAFLAMVVAVTIVATSCTHHESSDSPPATSTAGATTLDKNNAELRVSFVELEGVRKRMRAGLVRGIGEPIRAWMDAAYLAGDFPLSSYTGKAFPGWTPGAARLGLRDRRVTTNAAISKDVVNVVADQRSARLAVFGVRGRTGGADAQIHLKMTAKKSSGQLVSFAVAGHLYLTRKADHWSIFGYDLHRTVLR
ncbi:MAG TPA: hypothetical protein VH419_03340 [Nocardioidaceae bacterium]|jgi:hypothetical protein